MRATKAGLQLMVRIAAKGPYKGHQTIYKASHNRYLLQSVTTVALGLLRHATFVLPESAPLGHRGPRQIIKAIRARNPARLSDWRASTYDTLWRCA